MILACSDSMPSYIDTATKYILSYPLKSNPRCPLVCLNPSNQFLPSHFARRLQVPLRCWSVIRFTSHRFRTMILNIRCLTTPAFPLPPARTHARRQRTSNCSWRIASITMLPSLEDCLQVVGRGGRDDNASR